GDCSARNLRQLGSRAGRRDRAAGRRPGDEACSGRRKIRSALPWTEHHARIWRQPELTRSAFDEEGYYRMGDALRFEHPEHPEHGLVFDGRLVEDFKLSSGSWASVGPLRTRFIALGAPLVQEVVIAGHDRDYIAVLVFPRIADCR